MARPKDDDKRQRIISAATGVFGDLGYATATVKDIAARAEIAVGTVYTYFVDKEGLFRVAVAAAWAQFQAGMDRILQGDEPVSVRMSRLIDFGFDHLRDVYPAVRGMFSDANRMNLLMPHIEALTLALDRFFEQARRSGVIWSTRSARLRHFLLRCVVSGILLAAAAVEADRLDEVIATLREDTRAMLRESLFQKGAA